MSSRRGSISRRLGVLVLRRSIPRFAAIRASRLPPRWMPSPATPRSYARHFQRCIASWSRDCARALRAGFCPHRCCRREALGAFCPAAPAPRTPEQTTISMPSPGPSSRWDGAFCGQAPAGSPPPWRAPSDRATSRPPAPAYSVSAGSRCHHRAQAPLTQTLGTVARPGAPRALLRLGWPCAHAVLRVPRGSERPLENFGRSARRALVLSGGDTASLVCPRPEYGALRCVMKSFQGFREAPPRRRVRRSFRRDQVRRFRRA